MRMTEKITGWVFIFIGVAMILGATANVVMVFLKMATPVQFFSFSGIGLDPAQLVPAQGAANLTMPTGVLEVIPPKMINETSNIFAHMILMGFLVSTGSKIAAIGVQLVRPVVVKLHGLPEAETKN